MDRRHHVRRSAIPTTTARADEVCPGIAGMWATGSQGLPCGSRGPPVKGQTGFMEPSGPATRCVGAIVRDNSGALLLVLRANEPSAGLWSLPGGRIEPGETDHEAVRREMREETGLEVEVVAKAGTEAFGPYVVNDYVCTVIGGELVAGDDALDARWVALRDLADYELTPGLLETLVEWNAL